MRTSASRRRRPGTLGLRDVAGEAILLAGGARAILLQVAHPAVGRGVAEHSGFADDPMARLTATMGYVYGTVYGGREVRALVRDRVHAAHVPVHGPAAAGAVAYSADDPALQLWVAATLYDTTRIVDERVFGPLEDASADRLHREFGVVGTSLRLRDGDWPADRAAFARYWDSASAGLRVGDDARRIARDLLWPRRVPAWMRALLPPLRLVTAGLLPPALRADYGVRWTPAAERRYEAWMRTLAACYRPLPARLRLLYRDRLLAGLRRDAARRGGRTLSGG